MTTAVPTADRRQPLQRFLRVVRYRRLPSHPRPGTPKLSSRSSSNALRTIRPDVFLERRLHAPRSPAQFLKAPQRLALLMNSLSIAPSTCQKAPVWVT
ncbi:hypothetical protein EYF80_035933 [Liparis tanakae]|uniref:Uncharacterized protein n=1 Tax=Liparis tanakae TaxID=230148 RepID=A0A4Z2GMI6_9TELE|nr:hypothetical protein EYF80_035933 [Liparis tanakae]